MPGALRQFRISATRRKRMARYIAYAAGEVVLIFIGITLAIAFENSNELRRLSKLEADALRTIGEDLEANIRELDRNIAEDEGTLAALEPMLQHLATRRAWHDSLGVPLGEVFFWSSPLLKNSGYESLKQLGLHLVESSALRDQVVHLYEGTYASLIDEQDHAQWVFWESVVFPIRNRELEYVDPAGVGPRAFKIRDYEGALDRGELLTALAQHRYFLRVGIEQRKDARTQTKDLLTQITSYIEQ